MQEIQIVKTDQGAVNARILAREAKADFRRIEAASVKLRTHFTSAEAKRLFVRMFSTLQLNAHFISVIARTRIDHQDIEKVETSLRADIDAAKDILNQALDGAEALFKANGISSVATYDTQPLEIEVGIPVLERARYLEVLNQFDQLMPLLQTLEIHEVITTQELDIQRATLKRRIKDIANSARRLATGLRRRMNAMAARDGERGFERGEADDRAPLPRGVPTAAGASDEDVVGAALGVVKVQGEVSESPGALAASAVASEASNRGWGDADAPAEAAGIAVARRVRRKVDDQASVEPPPALVADAEVSATMAQNSGPHTSGTIDAVAGSTG